MTMRRVFGRRAMLAAAGTAALTGIGACTNAANQRTGSGEVNSGPPFRFTDDRDKRVELPGRPKTIVAYAGSAAALWEYGIRVTGVFGPHRLPDGSNDPQVGNVDLREITSLGNAYGEFDVPRYVKLAPDLLVSQCSSVPGLWYVPEESADEITARVPSVGINMEQANARTVIERYEDLARALGADVESAKIRQERAELDRATRALGEIARQKGGLRVLALNSEGGKAYLGNPLSQPSLQYLAEAGVPITNVGNQEKTEAWFVASWEQLPRYPADLIIYDSRTQSLSLEELRQIPVFNELPAVRAGALAPWAAEAPYTYRGYTAVANEIAEGMTRATPRTA